MTFPVPQFLPPPMPHVLSQFPSLPDDGSKWILIGGAMLVVTYVFIRPMGRRKRDPLDRDGASKSSGLSQQRSVEREMSNLLVELSEMARQITAQLDTRAAKLELLIKEADEKLEALRAATDGSSPARAGDDRVGLRTTRGAEPPLAPAPPAPAPADRIDPRHERIYALADGGASAREIARELARPTGEIELILALRPQSAK